MKNKKFLLGLSLGLGGIATVVPLTLTSCSANESSKYKELIGRNIKFTDKNDKLHSGRLIKIDGDKIWIDTFNGIYDEALSIQEFVFSLESNNYVSDDNVYGTTSEIANTLTSIKQSILININYKEVESEFNRLLEQLNQTSTNDEIKKILKGMLDTFKKDMTYWTTEKMDDAIADVVQNKSLKKWQDFINYYVATYVWKREELNKKFNELKNNSEISVDINLLQLKIKLISIAFNTMSNLSVLKISK